MVPNPFTRRVLTPSLLALALAIGTVSGAVGRDAAAAATGAAILAAPNVEVAATGPQAVVGTRLTPDAALVGTSGERSTAVVPVLRPVSQPTVGAAAETTASSRYKGRNHVWMPSLKLDKSVTSYACSTKTYPGNHVYRWGCAGRNNVYLFGHADSVFKSLHDAYVRGRLEKGAKLYYADSSGRVHTYTVAWWKVTTPTKGTWAYAPQAKPSVTLQTCVGSRSQYRLIVRLTQVS